jgi:hypothetical protein
VTSPTCSSANDKFKWSHEIIVIKYKESLNFVVKIKLSGICEIVEQVISYILHINMSIIQPVKIYDMKSSDWHHPPISQCFGCDMVY